MSLGEDNQFVIDQNLFIHGFANVRDFESGINAGSIKSGEIEYLYLAPYPDLYIYKSNGDSLFPT